MSQITPWLSELVQGLRKAYYSGLSGQGFEIRTFFNTV